MPKKLDIEEILRKNPHIDKAKLREGRELSEQLRDLGLMGKGYNLVSPGKERRAQIADSKGQRYAIRLHGGTILRSDKT